MSSNLLSSPVVLSISGSLATPEWAKRRTEKCNIANFDRLFHLTDEARIGPPKIASIVQIGHTLSKELVWNPLINETWTRQECGDSLAQVQKTERKCWEENLPYNW